MPTPDVAYYRQDTFWGPEEGDWIKSLLLFFDRVAILLPRYMRGRPATADPVLSGPLEERGLLQVLDPVDWIDETMAAELAKSVVGLLRAGAFDGLSTDCQYHELSNSRLGYHADVHLAEGLVSELQARDLAWPSQDGVSIPLHPVVRKTILVILGQLSRPAGKRRGMAIHPITEHRSEISELVDFLERGALPSASNVVHLDIEPVALDLSLVPLEEVLEFRDEHQAAYRAYIGNLHRFLFELALVDNPADREAALAQRHEEISDAASDLRRATRHAFGLKLATWGLGITGAAWEAASNDPLAPILDAADIALRAAGQAAKARTQAVSAYSYIFDVQRNFGADS